MSSQVGQNQTPCGLESGCFKSHVVGGYPIVGSYAKFMDEFTDGLGLFETV